MQTEEQPGEQEEELGEEQIGRVEPTEGQEPAEEPLEGPQEEQSTKAQLQAGSEEPAKPSASCFCEESPEGSDSSNEKEPKVSTANLEAQKKKIRT